jgi:hypothetical protein
MIRAEKEGKQLDEVEEDPDNEEEEEYEKKPLGVVQPKYKVVHSYPVSI